MRNRLKQTAATIATGAVFLLSGCGMSAVGTGPTVTSAPLSRGSITGKVFGGNPPVTSAKVYLMAMGTTGYTSANTSLLTSGTTGTDSVGGYVLTDGDGSFSITGDYNCPATTNTPVYLLVLGGNPGLGAGNSNPNLAMLTAIGSCDTLKANAATTLLWINEVTTVASVYALAPFWTTTGGQPAGFGFSTSAANLTGMQAAAAMTSNLVNTATGAAAIANITATASVPQAEINTLADVLQSCINSVGGAPGSGTPCGSLFTATTAGSSVPTNTVTATYNIAANPSNNVSAIFNQSPAIGAAFVPALSTAPNDWTVALTYTGGGISTPQAVAVDATGNAWVTNRSNAVTKIAAASGAFLSGATGYTSGSLDAPVALAIDASNKVWIANCGATCSGSSAHSSLTAYVISGSTVTPANYANVDFNVLYSVAVFGSANVWGANLYGSSLTLESGAGAAQSGVTGYTATSLAYPSAVAVDQTGIAWAVSPSQNSVTGLDISGVVQSGTYTGPGLSTPTAIAIDHANRLWITNSNASANSVAVLGAGSPIAGSPFTGGGLLKPNAIAIDGSGNAWVANSAGRITVMGPTGSALSGTNGYQASFTFANGIATDASGSVWVTNCGTYCTGTAGDTGSVLQFIGAGSPTAVPLAAAAAAPGGALGTKP